ncbi:MAG: ribose-phosphate pyrophosphokinase [Alphaproteobacteria bacterium]|nr:ribose-phosphate pyrophosphokinase [Alphaproteobacteria bacterium]
MMPIILAWPDSKGMAQSLSLQLGIPCGDYAFHHFPDGESLPTIQTPVKGDEVIVVANLYQPDSKLWYLILLAETLRQLGATRVGLVAPYLGYMRQDTQFHPGEGVTSRIAATYLSKAFDWLVTVDPHLHRIHDLSEIYTIPTHNVHAASAIVTWIQSNVSHALLIGPDEESRQWVAELAQLGQLPFQVLTKERFGDHEVNVSLPRVSEYKNHTPVLVDDIISTAHTMIETVKHLQLLELKPAICIGTHPVFAEDAYQRLLATGVKSIITCNTIEHSSNQIDLSPLIARVIGKQ